jgi:hypothetical protein
MTRGRNALTMNRDAAAIERVVTNRIGVVRQETMQGEQYLVAPMVMLTEGVHNGSNGPLFYPGDELAKEPDAWNHVPIVVYHPEKDGQGVSARQPEVLNERAVGIVLNSRYDGKLRSEAWLSMKRLAAVDVRVLQAVQNNQLMEVSTGVFTSNEAKPGEWNGEAYSAIARNYRPDHLAILPDQKGACSIADGAGLLQLNRERVDHVFDAMGVTDATVVKEAEAKYQRDLSSAVARMAQNALSFDGVRQFLRTLIRDKLGIVEGIDTPGPYPYIEDVYDGFFIYELAGKLFRLGYTRNDSQVQLTDEEPEQVMRVSEYRKVADGAFVGNAEQFQPEGETMKKAQAIAVLIANGGYEESDRTMLSGMDEAKLVRMAAAVDPTPAGTQPVPDPKPTTPGQPADPPSAPPTGPTNPAPAQNADPQQAFNAWLNSCPPQFREAVGDMVANSAAERQQLAETVTTNGAEFGITAQDVAVMSVKELRRNAAMIKSVLDARSAAVPAAPAGGWYGGQATLPTANQSSQDVSKTPPLSVPSMF